MEKQQMFSEKQQILQYENQLLRSRNKILQTQNNKLLEQLTIAQNLIKEYNKIDKYINQLQQFKAQINNIIRDNIMQSLLLVSQQSKSYQKFNKMLVQFKSERIQKFFKFMFQEYRQLLSLSIQSQKQNKNTINSNLMCLNSKNAQTINQLRNKVNQNKIKNDLYIIRLPNDNKFAQSQLQVLRDVFQSYKNLLILFKNPILSNQNIQQICNHYYQNSILKLNIVLCEKSLNQIQQQWTKGLTVRVCNSKIQQITDQLNELILQRQQVKNKICSQKKFLIQTINVKACSKLKR